MAHLNAAGITRLVTKLKDRFAALSHTHAAATDITGQLPVANGGTGASTASGARTNLDAAQDDSSGITLASAASNISTLLATTGIASTPSGKTLQGQISTLQDSVSLPAGTYSFANLITAGYQSGSGNYLGFNIPYTFASSVANASIINVDLTLFRPNGAVGQFTSSDIDTTYIEFTKRLSYTKIELKFNTTQAKGLPVVVSVNTLQIRFT